jgi:hypothetical protein
LTGFEENTMRNFLLMPLPRVLLTACPTEGASSEDSSYGECKGGGAFVTVHYGDSEIKVHPVIKVKTGSVLEFRLKPNKKNSDEIDFEKVTVTIKGKDAAADWIDVNGTYNSSKGTLSVRVPPDQAEGVYQYLVNVDQVGQLDPRADVER